LEQQWRYTSPSFSLKADYDSTKLTTVRLTQMYADGTTVKRDIPQMDSTSIEAVLHCIQEYQETADEINLDGDELFINFRRTLCGIAKDDWDSVTALINNRTLATFLVALENWKSDMILPTAEQTLVDYLETIRKPHQMAVEAFVNRLRVMARHVNEIPFSGQDSPMVKTKPKLKASSSVGCQMHSRRISYVSMMCPHQQFCNYSSLCPKNENSRNNLRILMGAELKAI
jgi:hypothetical protein